ncbi:hypothetical protein K8T06_17995 [bacterium]|nr:hypothetical protein [bacterium]
MSVVQHILREEYDRLQELVSFYSEAIEKLPKGSISWKKRNDKIYAYLVYRDHKKIKFIYLGKENSEKAVEISRHIEARKEKEKLLRQVKANLKEIKKALHILSSKTKTPDFTIGHNLLKKKWSPSHCVLWPDRRKKLKRRDSL